MSTSLYPVISLAIAPSPYAKNGGHAAFIIERATAQSREIFAFLEAQLAKEGPWLMGEQYSALDIYLFMLGLWARPSEAQLHADFPHISALAIAVRRRPKLTAVLESHGVLNIGGYRS